MPPQGSNQGKILQRAMQPSQSALRSNSRSASEEYVPSSFDADAEFLRAVVAEQQARRVRRWSLTFLFAGLFVVLGGLEGLTAWMVGGDERPIEIDEMYAQPNYVDFPQNLGYFSLLAIPLVLYIVVARWTGGQIWRHSS